MTVCTCATIKTSQTDFVTAKTTTLSLACVQSIFSKSTSPAFSHSIVATQCSHPAILVERRSDYEFSQHQRSETLCLRRSYPSASSLVLSWCHRQSCASIFFAIRELKHLLRSRRGWVPATSTIQLPSSSLVCYPRVQLLLL